MLQHEEEQAKIQREKVLFERNNQFDDVAKRVQKDTELLKDLQKLNQRDRSDLEKKRLAFEQRERSFQSAS